MQRISVKWWMPLILLGTSLLWSTDLSRRKFISLHQPLVVKAQKNSPPHIAFEALLQTENAGAEWASIAKLPTQSLAAGTQDHQQSSKALVQLAEMVIKKKTESITLPRPQLQATLVKHTPARSLEQRNLPIQRQQTEMAAEPMQDTSWIEALPKAQQRRIRQAQEKSEVLDQNWKDNSWSAFVQQVIQDSEKGLKQRPSASSPPPVHVATQTPRRSANQEGSRRLPTTSVDDDISAAFVSNSGPFKVTGPIEISGGLAITNEHHFEIRRNHEGIIKELGSVDLKKGTYSIPVEDTSGVIVAQLIDQHGRAIGEGEVRLKNVNGQNSELEGPKLKLVPSISIASRVASVYGDDYPLPANTRATFVKGAGDESVDKSKMTGLENVVKGSVTVMRVAAAGHLQTTQLVTSGEESKSILFSDKIIKALEEIISDNRKVTLSSGSKVIWGQVLLDGKPKAGVRVELESALGLQAVYLNELLLPDFSLTQTGSNGSYVFIDVPEGFHSLLATLGEQQFGFQNVMIESGSVAVANIESKTKSEMIPLRVYDAFSGEPKNTKIALQSMMEEVTAENGFASVKLAGVSRLGLMRLHPEGADYLPARYIYNDQDSYIHAPLIQWNWLSSIKAHLRLEDQPYMGIIVGFVPDENFEVHLADYDQFDSRQIVYFDAQGQLTESKKGVSGGGFILYNVPPDTHEVVVLGEKTRKLSSKLLPVDADSLSVLNFK